MKRLLLLTILLLARFSWAQPQAANQSTQPQHITASRVDIPPIVPALIPVSKVNVTEVGNPGNATYCYWVVTNYSVGSATPVFAGCVFQGHVNLDSTHYQQITYSLPAQATSVDVLRNTTMTQAPSGACNCAVATASSSGTVNDQSNTLSSYTVTAFDPSTLDLSLTNEVVGAGASDLILRQNNAEICDLSLHCSGSSVTGSGTANTVTKWTGTSTLGNSSITDNGTAISSSEPATFHGVTDSAVTGSTQCAQFNSSGTLSGTGATCGSGGGTVGGSGTTGDIPIWTASTTLGNSAISQSGSGASGTLNINDGTLSLTPTSNELINCSACQLLQIEVPKSSDSPLAAGPAIQVSTWDENYNQIALYTYTSGGGFSVDSFSTPTVSNPGSYTSFSTVEVPEAYLAQLTYCLGQITNGCPPGVGTIVYCNDCSENTVPCSTLSGTGSGSFAFQVNGTFDCGGIGLQPPSAGVVTLASGTATHTFTIAYGSAPVCTLGPSITGNTYKVSSTTTTVSVTSSSGSDTSSVNWTCVAAYN